MINGLVASDGVCGFEDGGGVDGGGDFDGAWFGREQ